MTPAGHGLRWGFRPHEGPAFLSPISVRTVLGQGLLSFFAPSHPAGQEVVLSQFPRAFAPGIVLALSVRCKCPWSALFMRPAGPRTIVLRSDQLAPCSSTGPSCLTIDTAYTVDYGDTEQCAQPEGAGSGQAYLWHGTAAACGGVMDGLKFLGKRAFAITFRCRRVA